MKAAFYTLGCKTNQFETQALERLFSARGYLTVPFEEKADVYVINTCSVTAVADKKSRAAIRAAKKRAPGACIAVCGCYSEQVAENEIKACGADIVIGSADKSRLPGLAEEYLKTRSYTLPAPSGAFDFMPAGGLSTRTRALLKVQDGCRNFCTYCIIPFLRGELKSLPLSVAAGESARLEREGYREIVITGIEISSYGLDLEDKPTLSDLLDAVCTAAPDTRVRLGSLEPRTVTEEWAKKAASYKNLCPHFHLSLQSGCDKILRAMGRRYDTERFLLSCEILRKYFPGCAITTDIIVGFPGETEEDLVATLDFISRFKPAQAHIFPYSRRKGTRAYSMPAQLTAAQKAERAERAAAAAKKTREEYLKTLSGKTLSVLFEQEKEGFCVGHCREYIPVYVKGKGLKNEILSVTAQEPFKDGLFGIIKEN
ncbi:MAG: tRNA (N(6)-L-threonylcarbamoyladenosine(37)-C(2))-methylthiotransferase MtaB [Clostridia bacterium]|nr:tRNA (N(6)-L-threonylcarbamoyladenosine(37)-C(2))-methylthiotransferase MtaB [Clostridia bacterium]